MLTQNRIGRRSILGLISGFPATVWLSAQHAVSSVLDRRDDDNDCDTRLAVQVMRLVNTAEHMHKHKYGGYVGHSELVESSIIDRMGTEEKFEKMGLGKSLLEQISFRNLNDSEVFPGWQLRIRHVGPERYVATMTSTSGEGAIALGTDESGVIYHGDPRSQKVSLEIPPTSLAELRWENLAPIGSRHRDGRFAKLHAVAMLLPLVAEPPQCNFNVTCYQCDSIDCPCYCQSSYPACCCCYGPGSPTCCSGFSAGCCNIGCGQCIWCCCCTPYGDPCTYTNCLD
jgi:hypothetical protein